MASRGRESPRIDPSDKKLDCDGFRLMNDSCDRLTQSGEPPTPREVAAWVGTDAYGFWKRVAQWIEQNYPHVFTPQWLFGGKKHGWSLRYKKGKSFCTLIPEKGLCTLLIVFGDKERIGVEAIRQRLSARTLKEYDKATTYHDGKWLVLTVDADAVLADVERLLAVKRKPKKAKP